MCIVHGYEFEIMNIHKVDPPICKISELLDLARLETQAFLHQPRSLKLIINFSKMTLEVEVRYD